MPFKVVAGAVAGIASIFGARSASKAADKAADAQVQSTQIAADQAREAAREANAIQLYSLEQQQQNLQPWLDAGRGALTTLSGMVQPGGELTRDFVAPAPFDPSKVTMDPGFDFRLREGQRAIERSAAARGGALGTGTLRGLARYGQDYASNEYGAAYGRAASEYDRNFNNAFNVFNANQTNKFNRLASLANVGQTATAQSNSAYGNYGANVSNTAMQTGSTLSDLSTQAGNARASGYVGAGNAWNTSLGNFANNFTKLFAGGKK